MHSSNALEPSTVKRILSAAITGTFALKLAVGVFLVLRFLQCRELRFGRDQAFLGALGLQCLQPFLYRLEIVPLPRAGRRPVKSSSRAF